jgi:hypothetical protein
MKLITILILHAWDTVDQLILWCYGWKKYAVVYKDPETGKIFYQGHAIDILESRIK